MSMAEFYIDNGIDPGDPGSMGAFMDGLDQGHNAGAYMYSAMNHFAEDEEEYDGFGNHGGPHCGGEAQPGSFGRKWRAVVQGKFRVQVRNPEDNFKHFDLFPSDVFQKDVATHKAAELSTPKRSIVEKRATLKFTGGEDKRNWVWYTDEEGVERKPIFAGITEPDMISFWLRDMFTFDPTQNQETGQDAEDHFWCAAVLWYHFGTSGNAAYDKRFNEERDAFQRSSSSGGGAAAAATASGAATAKEAAPPAAVGEGNRSRGTVLRWKANSTFGFIKPDGDESGDLFCHFTNIVDGDILVPGTVVEFDKEFDAHKGKHRAVNVTGGSAKGNGKGYGGGYRPR